MKTSLLKATGCAVAALLGMVIFTTGCAAQGTLQSALNQTKQSVQTPTVAPTTGAAIKTEILNDPTKATLKAPETFKVEFTTNKGKFVVEVTRAWSPNGADRFYNMVQAGFFNEEIVIFRAIKGFMFQFGIHGTPAIAQKWSNATIMDDPPAGKSNLPGTICFAKTGRPNSRSTQMFVNLGNNAGLDGQGFTPFGKVISGMDVVAQVFTGYGENRGNVQGEFKTSGNAYIKKKFPSCDSITSAVVLPN